MSSYLSVELERCYQSLLARLDQQLDALDAAEPGLRERFARRAHDHALQSLGLTTLQAELDTSAAAASTLRHQQRLVHQAMLATVRRVPLAEVADWDSDGHHPEVLQALQRRQTVHEEELLAQDEWGRAVLRLRQERTRLRETVALTLAPPLVRAWWPKALAFLGAEPTPLQRELLATNRLGPWHTVADSSSGTQP